MSRWEALGLGAAGGLIAAGSVALVFVVLELGARALEAFADLVDSRSGR